jgi:hypothetical protein
MDNATTSISQEDKQQSNNQPHPFDNESLLASSMNSFRFRLSMMEDDWHGER